jgi:regulator of PEP synthase PpsR (kinase-PPPase family)
MSQPPIFVVSGGMGISGEQLTRTALAQFQQADLPVVIVPHVDRAGQFEEVVAQAAASGGLIVHTLVNTEMRNALLNLAHEHNVVTVDLIGPLLLQLARLLGQMPVGQPGLYHQLREDYFKRVEAIEFTVAHDDGKKPHELRLADVVLVGVSRVGKTPLSVYLSTRGWKVANVPLIREVSPPDDLFQVDPRRVVGLVIEPDELAAFRRRRQHRLGMGPGSAYADLGELRDEVKLARELCARAGFAIVDITDKPIEESADEVIAHVMRRLRGEAPS